MNILYIHQYFVTPKDDKGTRSYEFSKALISKGHHVTMLTSDYLGKYKKLITRKNIDGIEVIYIRNRYSNKMSFFRRIYSFIRFMLISCFIAFRERNADLVFATSTPLTVGWIGRFKKRISKIPFIFEVRDLWPELPIEMGIIKSKLLIRILKSIEKKIYSSADQIIALSPGMKKGIMKAGVPNRKISLIPNGCDLKMFEKSLKKRVLRTRLNFSENDFILVFAGAHGMANGLDYVLDMAKYAQHLSNVKFVLIGNGSEKNKLITRKEKENIDNLFLLDPIPKLELVDYLQDADMGMQILKNIPAFYYGTSPNKFFDYISAGLPVLCNYPGWVTDMIKENYCGIVTNPEIPESFVKEFENLNLKADIEKMKFNALELAKSKFNREVLASQVIDIVQKYI